MLRASGDRVPDEVRSRMDFQGSKRRAMWWMGSSLALQQTPLSLTKGTIAALRMSLTGGGTAELNVALLK